MHTYVVCAMPVHARPLHALPRRVHDVPASRIDNSNNNNTLVYT